MKKPFKLSVGDLKGIGAIVGPAKKKKKKSSCGKQVGAKVIKFPEKKPNLSTVEKVLKAMSSETHYLMTKPIKLWDEYDMSNWRSLVKKYEGHGSVQANPSWVMDEDKWAKARKDALKSRSDDHPMYWGLVTTIYKQAGGRIRPGVDAQVGGEIEERNEIVLDRFIGNEFVTVRSNHQKVIATGKLGKIAGTYRISRPRASVISRPSKPAIPESFQGFEIRFDPKDIQSVLCVEHDCEVILKESYVAAQVGANAETFVDQLAKGIEHEGEHEGTLERLFDEGANAVSAKDYTSAKEEAVDKAICALAQDHIRKIKDYYDRLENMEQEAKGSVSAQVGVMIDAFTFVDRYPAYVNFVEAMSVKHYAPVFKRLREIDPHDLIRPEAVFFNEDAARGFVLRLFQQEAKKMGLLK